jgi:hypothetical protein
VICPSGQFVALLFALVIASEVKQSITPQLSLEEAAAGLLNQTPALRNGYPVYRTIP